MAGNSNSAVLSSNFLHLVNETGGTAGNGSGNCVLRQAADDDGSVNGSSLHSSNQALVLAELLSSDSSSSLVVGTCGSLNSAGGVAGNAGVEADNGDFLLSALFQDLDNSGSIQSSQSQSNGTLSHFLLDHIDLSSDLRLGSGAVEVDLYAVLSSSCVSAGLNSLPELVLEALSHNGDVHSSGSLFLSSLGSSGSCLSSSGSSLGSSGSSFLCATSDQANNHDQSQQQSNQFLHLWFPPKEVI